MQRLSQPNVQQSELLWFHALGFHFDPFQHLEASTDPHLIEYMVGHEVFAAAWDATPSLIFAPPGGGKTAMRIYTERACWSSFGPRHPFPVLYMPKLGDMDADEYPLERHCQRLVQAVARSLLLGLIIQPERLLDCSVQERRRVGDILANLPRSTSYYANILRTTDDVNRLRQHLGSATWPVVSLYANFEKRNALCDLLDEVATSSGTTTINGCAHFVETCEILQTSLGYRAMFVLVDGIDALPESAHEPAVGVRWLRALLTAADSWSMQGVFLKGFLPDDYNSILLPLLNGSHQFFAHTTIRWETALLAEMLRRRIAVASRGAFGSLDAISSPALRDLETLISKRVLPLPREAIVFVRDLLQRAVQTSGSATVVLEPETLEQTTAWYRAECSRLGLDALTSTPVDPAMS